MFLPHPLSKLTRALLGSANLVENQHFKIGRHRPLRPGGGDGGSGWRVEGGVLTLRTLHPHKKGEFFKKAN